MRISEYIEIMKNNRPEVLDPNNLYQQFYQVHDKLVDLLFSTGKITRYQRDKLFMLQDCLIGEIIMSWVGPDFELVCKRKDDNSKEIIYNKVLLCIEPKTMKRNYLVGESVE